MFELGVIGPEDLVLETRKTSINFKNIKVNELPYYENDNLTPNFTQAYELVKNNEKDVDGFLFTGPLPYYKVMNKEITSKYLFYYPIHGTAIYKTLMKISIHKNINIERVSIDTLPSKEIYKIYKELNLNTNKILINDDKLEDFSHNKFVDFHYKAFNSGKTEASVTAIKSIYQTLKLENVPVSRITPTHYTRKRTLEFIDSFIEKKQIMDNGVAIIKFEIAPDEEQKSLDKFDAQQKELALFQRLLEFSRNYFGILFNINNGYIIFMNKKTLQDYTNNFSSFPFVQEIKSKLSIEINVGIGIGNKINIAENRLEKVFKMVQNDKNNNVYINASSKEIFGPINNKPQNNQDFNKKKVNKISNESNINENKIIKINNLLELKEDNIVTTKELAGYLSVSLRTGNRIIKKLLKTSYATEVGHKKTSQKGRPSKTYKLDFGI